MNQINLISTLNNKEKQTYDLLCLGYRNEQIAETLGVSVPTIVKRLEAIYKKLGVQSIGRIDRHGARQRAIAYGGTKLEQKIGVIGNGYSEDQIRLASMSLVKNGLYESRLANMFIADLILILDKKI